MIIFKKEDGLNDLFAMMVNGLMLIERQVFLSNNKGIGNKGNGCRQAHRSGIRIEITVAYPKRPIGCLPAYYIRFAQ